MEISLNCRSFWVWSIVVIFPVFSWQSTRLQEFLKWSIQMDPGRIDTQIASLYMYIKYVHMHIIWLIVWNDCKNLARKIVMTLPGPYSSAMVPFCRSFSSRLLARHCNWKDVPNWFHVTRRKLHQTNHRGFVTASDVSWKIVSGLHNLYKMTSIPMRSDGF